jgi:peroxiredoxin
VLAEGDKAPDFSLPDQREEMVKLSDLEGQTVVLYFYPHADTVSYNCSNGRAGSHRHHPGL